ncbi:MAG TPA: pyridoxamine 5'-phosphate oxidase family protein [Candidatus Dormibacteraeota bacterium]|nr:pyridoxamine 5'-phosphate oxidase family protein [Candidatus Dormibacteraeota bacterium]
MDAKTEDFIRTLLSTHNLMTLATVREDGYPQATRVGYANDGLTVYVGVARDSQKVRNIERCEKVSLTVDGDYQGWNDIQGLSMGATAHVLTDSREVGHAMRLLTERFPEMAQMIEAETPSETSSMALLKITPTVVSVLDYTKGFGHTELVTV